MNQADRIRGFVLLHFVQAARAQGRTEIIIRAGDVHRAMGLISAMPAVCSAIGSNKFNELASATALARTGPANGANAYFRFSLHGHDFLETSVFSTNDSLTGKAEIRNLRPNLSGAVALVSCVKSKQPHSSRARDLYTSSWFTKVRDLVEESGARWFILSSLYGLVRPDAEIAPYDYTLNRLGVSERRAWPAKVLDQLIPELANEKRVVMFAGYRYREFLVEPLRRNNIEVMVPMQSLRRGEQLAWLHDKDD